MTYHDIYKQYSLVDIKMQLMSEISEWIDTSSLKQIDAAKILLITRPRVSDLVNGKTDKFTIDALVKLLERTGRQVVVAVEPLINNPISNQITNQISSKITNQINKHLKKGELA